MALKACKECGREISSDANPCPHCGKRNPHGALHSFRRLSVGAFVVVVGLPVAMGLIAADCHPAEAPKLVAEAPEVVPNPTPAVQATPTPTSQQYVLERHVAYFEGDKLEQCIDVRVVFDAPSIPAGWAPQEPVDKEGVRIQRPCQEQFAGMTTLAKCVVPESSGVAPDAQGLIGATARRSMEVRYFQYAIVFEEHANMKDCLQIGGDWKAVPEDSSEYRRARLEHHTGRVFGLAKRAGAF